MDNKITKILLNTLNILFLYNVLGTAYGCLFGLLLLSLQDVAAVYLPVIGLIRWYGFIVFGVLTFNIRPMVKQKYIDPRIEQKLKYVREILNEGNFSEKEKKQHWRKLILEILNELPESAIDKKHYKDFDDNVID